jgi:hypothetical protein
MVRSIREQIDELRVVLPPRETDAVATVIADHLVSAGCQPQAFPG